jgi:hypothetical protein
MKSVELIVERIILSSGWLSVTPCLRCFGSALGVAGADHEQAEEMIGDRF